MNKGGKWLVFEGWTPPIKVWIMLLTFTWNGSLKSNGKWRHWQNYDDRIAYGYELGLVPQNAYQFVKSPASSVQPETLTGPLSLSVSVIVSFKAFLASICATTSLSVTDGSPDCCRRCHSPTSNRQRYNIFPACQKLSLLLFFCCKFDKHQEGRVKWKGSIQPNAFYPVKQAKWIWQRIRGKMFHLPRTFSSPSLSKGE